MAPRVSKDKKPSGQGQSESAEIPAGITLTVSPSPAPIGTTRLDITGTGFPEGYLSGTVSGRGPGFEFVGGSDRIGVWENPNAPLGVGVVNVAETHWVSITDAQGNEIARQEFEVV